MKNIVFAFCISLCSAPIIVNAGFITEVINDTNKDIFVEFNLASKAKLISCVSLISGDEIFLPTRDVFFRAHTKNVIEGLEIPFVPAWVNEMGKPGERVHLYNSISLKYRESYTSEVHPNSIMGVSQKGDLLQITCPSTGIRSINLFNNIRGGKSFRLLSNEMITPDAAYSITIKQLKKCIDYYGMNLMYMMPDTLDIIVSKSSISVDEFTVKDNAKAYIATFRTGDQINGTCGALVKFESPVRLEFFKEFADRVLAVSGLKNATNIIIDHTLGTIAFVFFTNIKLDQFQNYLDIANK